MNNLATPQICPDQENSLPFPVAEAIDSLVSLGEESESNNSSTLPSPPLNGSGSPDV